MYIAKIKTSYLFLSYYLSWPGQTRCSIHGVGQIATILVAIFTHLTLQLYK